MLEYLNTNRKHHDYIIVVLEWKQNVTRSKSEEYLVCLSLSVWVHDDTPIIVMSKERLVQTEWNKEDKLTTSNTKQAGF